MTTELPKWMERQRLLAAKEGDLDRPRLSALGTTALAKGYVQDALWYFQAAEDRAGIEKIKQLAVGEGDSFLLDAIEKVHGEISPDLWNQLGYQAFDLGKFRFAKRAFERTANELMLAKIRATLGEPEPTPPSDDPESPPA